MEAWLCTPSFQDDSWSHLQRAEAVYGNESEAVWWLHSTEQIRETKVSRLFQFYSTEEARETKVSCRELPYTANRCYSCSESGVFTLPLLGLFCSLRRAGTVRYCEREAVSGFNRVLCGIQLHGHAAASSPYLAPFTTVPPSNSSPSGPTAQPARGVRRCHGPPGSAVGRRRYWRCCHLAADAPPGLGLPAAAAGLRAGRTERGRLVVCGWARLGWRISHQARLVLSVWMWKLCSILCSGFLKSISRKILPKLGDTTHYRHFKIFWIICWFNTRINWWVSWDLMHDLMECQIARKNWQAFHALPVFILRSYWQIRNFWLCGRL